MADSGCSTRSKRLLKPMLSYIGAFIKAMEEGLWDEKERPDGWIPLVVAENKLGNAQVLERLEAVGGSYPASCLNYAGMKGIPELQEALARLMERSFLPGHTIDPNNLCISTGCTAILDNLFFCTCDAGDGILIPAPYYPAFDNDLRAKCEVHPLPVHLRFPKEKKAAGKDSDSDSDDDSDDDEEEAGPIKPLRQQLDAAVADAAGKGIKVKGLLITNPNNPLGTIYSDAAILEMVRWCLDNSVHYISDEIYALSVFKPEARFTSAITLVQQLVAPPPPAETAAAPAAGEAAAPAADVAAAAATAAAPGEAPLAPAPAAAAEAGSTDGQLYSQLQVDTYVHMVYGLSKDWCASGLRVGVLYSRNQRLQQSLNSISAFASVSNHTQWGLAQVLNDQEWTASFVQQNQKALEKSYNILTEALKQGGFPFKPAVAGMFVWIDLSKHLTEDTWEAELEFWKLVCSECKVILTPGKDCHAAKPGWFRLCFAWMPPEALKEAVSRLKEAVGKGQTCSIQ